MKQTIVFMLVSMQLYINGFYHVNGFLFTPGIPLGLLQVLEHLKC